MISATVRSSEVEVLFIPSQFPSHLWISIQSFNWFKSVPFSLASPGNPLTKRTSAKRSQVKRNGAHLCSLIFKCILMASASEVWVEGQLVWPWCWNVSLPENKSCCYTWSWHSIESNIALSWEHPPTLLDTCLLFTTLYIYNFELKDMQVYLVVYYKSNKH